MNVESVIDKIKACIRLANKTTENGERDTAMRMARSLADKNGIALDEITDTESCDRSVIDADDSDKCFSGCEMGYVYYVLREHFGVIVMTTYTNRSHTRRRHTWFGSRLNIAIAKHVMHVLLRECRRAYDEERRSSRSDRDIYERMLRTSGRLTEWEITNEMALIPVRKVKRHDFMQGFFCAINEYLTKHPLRNDLVQSRASAERKLDEFRKNHDVKDKTTNGSRKVDARAFNAGRASGSKVRLARPCEGSSTSPLALTA